MCDAGIPGSVTERNNLVRRGSEAPDTASKHTQMGLPCYLKPQLRLGYFIQIQQNLARALRMLLGVRNLLETGLIV